MSGAPTPTPRNVPHDPALGFAALSAPWRMEYIESLSNEPASSGLTAKSPKPAASPDGCFLRDYWLDPANDDRNHVIVRVRFHPPAGVSPSGDAFAGMILLNAYPYANGHLLVALAEGRPTLLDYDANQRAALWRLTDLAAALMQDTLEPQGINIGINQGRAAGAGVPGHLHVHLVPRWNGDVNFMASVGRVRVIPSSLDAMLRRYRTSWDRLRPRSDAAGL